MGAVPSVHPWGSAARRMNRAVGCSGLSARGVRRTADLTVFSYQERPALPPTLVPFRSVFTTREWQTIIRGLALSPRQAEVLRMLFDGYSDKQIARKLKVTLPTVRSHLQRMYAKFRVQDRTALVVYIFAWFRHREGVVTHQNNDIRSMTSN